LAMEFLFFSCRLSAISCQLLFCELYQMPGQENLFKKTESSFEIKKESRIKKRT
jgi:hypothetical protein